MKCKYAPIFAASLCILMMLQFSTMAAAQGEPPLPPEDPTQPWFPPNDGELPGQIYTLTLTTTTTTGGPFMTWFTDAQGNRKTEFQGSDVVFFFIQTNFARSRVWVAEYYPPGSSPSRHWLIWRQFLGNAGQWMWGPFIFEQLEPQGTHSWRIWMLDLTTGAQVDNIARFNYKTQGGATVTRLSASAASLKTTDSVTLTSTTTDQSGIPVSGGTITMSYNSGSGWNGLPGCSGPVSAGSYTCTWKPGNPGTYSVRADYTGQGNYQPSSSQAVAIEVEIPESALSIDAKPSQVNVGDNVVISGRLTESASGNPIVGAYVIISLTSSAGSTPATAQTDAAGAFSYNYKPSKAGDFTVQASYAGDKLHKPTVAPSVSFTATSMPVKITLEADKADVGRDIITGSTPSITLTGSTDPQLANVPIRIEIKGPEPTTDSVTTEVDGSFSYEFTPPAEGSYKIVAYYDGSDQYAKAQSTATKITVGPDWTIALVIVGLVAILAVVGIAYWRGWIHRGKGQPGILPPPPQPRGLLCPSCGVRNRPGATFCKGCATSLGQGAGIFCPSCHASNKASAGYCKRCGTRLR